MPESLAAQTVDQVAKFSPTACAQKEVLFVDLDGSLVKTDLLCESLLLAVRRDPKVLLRLPGWLLRGRPVLKRELALRAIPDMRRLPYRDEVVEFLQEQRKNGVRLVLATASDALLARELAIQLGLFDDVLASDAVRNLKAGNKQAAIDDYCREHGFADFGYVGDSHADLAIWPHAARAFVVSPSWRLRRRVDRLATPVTVFESTDRKARALLRALRPGQWIKNILIFAPLLLAHDFTDPRKVLAALLALAAFCCAASATYLVNDLLDIEADRSHPLKRRRVFASGDLPVSWGPWCALGLFMAAILIAVLGLPLLFTAAVVVYVISTTLYTVWLKRVVLVDVFLLAGLYTLRVLAGGAATEIHVSEWLLALSMFLFLSLAFGKRYAELTQLTDDVNLHARGRGYLRGDLSLLESLGPVSGYMAVLVLALYIHGEVAEQLYPNRWALWLICPLLLYWISRFWLLCKRGRLSDDPLVFATKDRISLAIGAVSTILTGIAMWPLP